MLGSRRPRGASLYVMLLLSFLTLGWAWSFASPPGSAADEQFHLTTIWCAWGESDSCAFTDVQAVVRVPERVAHASCFAQLGNDDARCTLALTDALVETQERNRSWTDYPPVYHPVMRAFVGPDVARSVLVMRLFNVALAALLLTFALLVARPVVRRAIALGWAVCLVPTGIFFIASVNPSGWAITGASLYWAFLYTLVVERTFTSRRGIAAAVGAGFCALMAVAARPDAISVILLSTIAVALMTWPHLRARLKSLWWLLAFVPLVVVAGVSNVGKYARPELIFPAGNPEFDQPNSVVKILVELPSFLAGLVGGQSPLWSQRASSGDSQLPGFSWPGFTYGVGALDVQNPEISGLLVLASVSAVFFLGFARYNWRKVAAVALLTTGLIGQILVMRGFAAFQPVSFLQPRYYFAFAVVIVSIAAVTYPRRRNPVNRAQAGLLVGALTIAGGAALMATIGRFAFGQSHSWTGIIAEPGWWWERGPSPLATAIIGGLAGLIWLMSMMLIARRSSSVGGGTPSRTPGVETSLRRSGTGSQPFQLPDNSPRP